MDILGKSETYVVTRSKSKQDEEIKNVAKNEMVECEEHSQDVHEDVDLIDFSASFTNGISHPFICPQTCINLSPYEGFTKYVAIFGFLSLILRFGARQFFVIRWPLSI
jgi:hypothetical protein